MVPCEFGSSDGMFNLGSSLAFVQTLPPGIYVSMNGKCFPWDQVKKDNRTGESVETRKPDPALPNGKTGLGAR